MSDLILFGLVNLIVSILSGASGGAGGLISTPFMVLLGLSPAQAIATAKFGGLGISLGSSGRFFREKITDRRTVIIFSIMGGIGALAGSLTLSAISDQTALLENLMGLAILLLGIPMLYIRKSGLQTKVQPRWLKILGLILLTLTVFLQAAIGSGIGSLQMIVLIGCFGMTALVASATRRFMQLTVAIVALTVFVATGLVDYQFGAVSFFTALAGGYIGANIALKKGDKFVMNLLAFLSGLLALELLFG